MARQKKSTLKNILDVLKREGLLLQSDSKVPSVVTLVVGEPVKGSWWGHPLGDTIHILNQELRDHKDVLLTYLVSKKITYIHRNLWPQLFGAVSAEESWQRKGLINASRSIFKLTCQYGRLRADDKKIVDHFVSDERRNAIRELEYRMLLHTMDTHTDRGTHVKMLQTWQQCRKEKNFRRLAINSNDARKELDRIIEEWNKKFGARTTLPWHRKL